MCAEKYASQPDPGFQPLSPPFANASGSVFQANRAVFRRYAD
jgi:hypothetical protein